ncbi:MAG: hypothetical protein O3B01_26555 [Planctomycetota bacterium]|nr:hypothetical protein [Planctomycetota bacterium]MDA1142138.1 hypothetical protein [Planctomycetota bacterium]
MQAFLASFVVRMFFSPVRSNAFAGEAQARCPDAVVPTDEALWISVLMLPAPGGMFEIPRQPIIFSMALPAAVPGTEFVRKMASQDIPRKSVTEGDNKDLETGALGNSAFVQSTSDSRGQKSCLCGPFYSGGTGGRRFGGLTAWEGDSYLFFQTNKNITYNRSN